MGREREFFGSVRVELKAQVAIFLGIVNGRICLCVDDRIDCRIDLLNRLIQTVCRREIVVLSIKRMDFKSLLLGGLKRLVANLSGTADQQ